MGSPLQGTVSPLRQNLGSEGDGPGRGGLGDDLRALRLLSEELNFVTGKVGCAMAGARASDQPGNDFEDHFVT